MDDDKKIQYAVLIIGTIIFAYILYYLVDKDKTANKFQIDKAEFTKQTIEATNVYSLADKSSTVLLTVPSNTKITTTDKTKFFYKVIKIDGQTSFSEGYILKKQVTNIEK